MMTKSWLDLEDKVMIVTGGSSGIGAAIVKELLNQGAYVYNADLKAGTEQNEKLTFIPTDVTAADKVNELVQQVIAKHHRIDGLVNNAGINLPRLLVDAKEVDCKI